MGVPKFFRWISARYPCINCVVNADNVPVIDHFYLDMNGILHTCSHPNDGANIALPEHEIFNNIKIYISFLVQFMKPRKSLFLAVDGVAPRAKMTQQRARRFQAAQEARTAKANAERKGHVLNGDLFDPCVISPGTEFMERLHLFLIKFVEEQVQHDPIWRRIDVILSGHDCPGEGEHKIREYMSYKRTQSDYHANERHCIYGMDADLIFLGLTTHEMNMCILRENVIKSVDCKPEQMPFCVTYLSVLREYIDYEFRALKETLPFEYDIERLLDDWIFMAFLLGNDFIPHIPNLHIHAESLLVLWDTYNVVLPQLDGYLIEYGRLHLERFHRYIAELSKFEQDWFEEREADHRWMRGKQGAKLAEQMKNLGAPTEPVLPNSIEPPAPIFNLPLPTSCVSNETAPEDLSELAQLTNLFASSNLCETNDIVDELAELAAEGLLFGSTDPNDTLETEYSDEAAKDEAGLDEEDVLVYKMYRRDYYRSKMGIEEVSEEDLKHHLMPIVTDYVRMLQWILNYYYLRVADWNFYYHYHYAPFARDLLLFTQSFVGEDSREMNFGDSGGFSWAQFDTDSKPVLPFVQQLMILPADCAYIVPKVYRPLMTDASSPLAPFFPESFATDINGKIASWEAVVLIPFIDDHILSDAMTPFDGLLGTAEVQRNRHKSSRLYSAQSTALSNDKVVRPNLIEYDFLRNGVMFDKSDFRVHYQCSNRWVKEDFPSLLRINIDVKLLKIPVHIFESPSKLDSLALILNPPYNEVPTMESLANQILGRAVRVRWPHCATVMPVRLMSSKEIWELRDFNRDPLYSGIVTGENHQPLAKSTRFLYTESINNSDPSEVEWFQKRVDELRYKLRIRRAILSPTGESESTNSNPILIFSRKLEGWSICQRENDSTDGPRFILTPSFTHSSLSNGDQLRLAAHEPNPYGFAPPISRGRRGTKINQPTLRTDSFYGSCGGLDLDMYELSLPDLPPVSPFHSGSQSESGSDASVDLDTLFYPSQVVLLKSHEHTGRVAQVSEVDQKQGKVLVRCYPDINNRLDLSPLKAEFRIIDNSCHIDLWGLSHMTQLPKSIVAYLTGIVFVVRAETCGDDQGCSADKSLCGGSVNASFQNRKRPKSWKIGLNLRRNKTHDQVLGWSQFSKAECIWRYSDKVADLLINLKQKFPDLLPLLMRDDQTRSSIFYTELDVDYLNAVVKMIEDAGCHSNTLLAPANGYRLVPDLVQRLRDVVQEAAMGCSSNVTNQEQILSCEPEDLLAPAGPQQSLIPLNSPNQHSSHTFEVLDRVVFCKSGHTVPLGLSGTIIGIIPDRDDYLAEVMFDKEFPGAVSMRGSGPCCASVRRSALINAIPYSRTSQTSTTVKQDSGAISSPPLVSGLNDLLHAMSLLSQRGQDRVPHQSVSKQSSRPNSNVSTSVNVPSHPPPARSKNPSAIKTKQTLNQPIKPYNIKKDQQHKQKQNNLLKSTKISPLSKNNAASSSNQSVHKLPSVQSSNLYPTMHSKPDTERKVDLKSSKSTANFDSNIRPKTSNPPVGNRKSYPINNDDVRLAHKIANSIAKQAVVQHTRPRSSVQTNRQQSGHLDTKQRNTNKQARSVSSTPIREVVTTQPQCSKKQESDLCTYDSAILGLCKPKTVQNRNVSNKPTSLARGNKTVSNVPAAQNVSANQNVCFMTNRPQGLYLSSQPAPPMNPLYCTGYHATVHAPTVCNWYPTSPSYGRTTPIISPGDQMYFNPAPLQHGFYPYIYDESMLAHQHQRLHDRVQNRPRIFPTQPSRPKLDNRFVPPQVNKKRK